jgi:hypothetical protein
MRLYVLTVMLAVVATSTSTLASPRPRTTTHVGSIRLAHGAFNAVTAVGAACDPTSPLNGIDGVWYKIPRGATRVTFTPSALLDADLLFRTGTCQGITDGGVLNGQGYGRRVSGPVPKNASFVLVNGWLGTGAFTVTFVG